MSTPSTAAYYDSISLSLSLPLSPYLSLSLPLSREMVVIGEEGMDSLRPNPIPNPILSLSLSLSPLSYTHLTLTTNREV